MTRTNKKKTHIIVKAIHSSAHRSAQNLKHLKDNIYDVLNTHNL